MKIEKVEIRLPTIFLVQDIQIYLHLVTMYVYLTIIVRSILNLGIHAYIYLHHITYNEIKRKLNSKSDHSQ